MIAFVVAYTYFFLREEGYQIVSIIKELLTKTSVGVVLFAALSGLILHSQAKGCACGCGVYTVGTRWMMVTSPGPRLFLQYSYLDQNQNWAGLGESPATLNSDRLIKTGFFTFGGQYMFDRDWGIMAELPFWTRSWEGIGDNALGNSINHAAFGDVRVMGMYTGVSEDMSTALQAGVKIPTGPFTLSGLDRDLQIGTGTIDGLVSGYQMVPEDGWGLFAQISADFPLNERSGYKPGTELNGAIGGHYEGLLSDFNIVPIVSIIGSFRGRDSGVQADPDNTGYTRIFFSPGIEVILADAIHLNFDFGIPLYSNVNGNQLLSRWLINSVVSYQF